MKMKAGNEAKRQQQPLVWGV